MTGADIGLIMALARSIPGTAAQAAVEAQLAAEAAAEEAVEASSKEVYVSGTTPTITGEANTRYICGEVSTISITPSATGMTDVVFESGTTPAVLTVPSTVLWPEWFDPDNLEASTTYELNILDDVYGVVATWA